MPLFLRSCRRWQWLALLLVSVTSTGCTNILLPLMYVIGGPPMIEPDFYTQTRHKITDKNKPVVILCWVPDEIRVQSNESAVDYELSKYLAMTLVQGDKKIKVVDPDLVQEWMRNNPDWTDAREIGEHFGAGYLIKVDLSSYNLFEESSTELYRGRSDYIVNVMDVDSGKDIYTKGKQSKWPTSVPHSADEMPLPRFKQMYLTALSAEIGKLFYEVGAGDDIKDRAILN